MTLGEPGAATDRGPVDPATGSLLIGTIVIETVRAPQPQPLGVLVTLPAPATDTRDPLTTFRSDIGDRVFFAPWSDRLGTGARQVLAAQAVWIARHPHLTVTIVGHADEGGSGADNKRIAEDRARAVAERLAELGVKRSRMTVLGRGNDDPVAICGTAACAAQNRRVVTVLSATPPAGAAIAEEVRP